MYKMSSQIENIINAYKTLAKIPLITGGKLNNAGKKVTAKWSVRNLDKGKNTKYVSTYTIDDSLSVIDESEYGTDISNELLSAVSPRETFKALIREEKNGKDVKKQYLEVWNKNTIAHSVDLTALDIHGDVYVDSEFGCLDWSDDETSLVYIAEKKLQKCEPYIKRKAEDRPKTDGSGETVTKKGEEYLYRQDWGEQLVGKVLSVIVVCKLPSETFTVLEGLPESWCPGQVIFSPGGNSVVGVAWETEPRRLGLIFCTNRPSWIFSLTLDGDMKKLSADGLAVRSPRYSPLGDLVWLQRQAGGPHHSCHQLVIKKKDLTEVTSLIDIVQTNIELGSGQSFYGLYCLGLPKKCFSSNGSRIVLSTAQKNEVRSYVVYIDGSKIIDISNTSPGSTSVLDVRSDIILGTWSSLTTPGQLFVAKLPPVGEEGSLKWVRISQPIEPPTSVANSTVEYMDLEHSDSKDPVKSFNALYLAPKAEGKNLPLIVWPHGGPHSSFVNAYSLETSLFNMLVTIDIMIHTECRKAMGKATAINNFTGFATVLVNYRGSTGAGEASVQCLLKNAGDYDVKDCKLATDEVMKKHPCDGRNLCLFGGSHGGFLVTHLSGQYPDTYRAVVTRNPVTDVATMINSTDIADCCVNENKAPDDDGFTSEHLKMIGFVSTRINFRGSVGQGDSNVYSLISNVGDYDVRDCYLVLTTLLKRDQRLHDIFLYGGSYGGFVVAHMAGLFPDKFKAVVMRNPLIDLATKGYYADNSDGCAVEAGYPFTEAGPISDEQLLAMRRCSPIAHVHKVRAPTALMLGSVDKRVPCYQGLEYARRLKANGVTTRIYMYDDNHSLSSPAAEMDNLINSANWFMEHLQS